MWSLIIIQWVHVLLGIFWFGSTLYVDFVLIPAIMTLPLEQQRAVSKPLATFAERVGIPAAILVIILGLVRGTIFGPVHSWSFVFGTDLKAVRCLGRGMRLTGERSHRFSHDTC